MAESSRRQRTPRNSRRRRRWPINTTKRFLLAPLLLAMLVADCGGAGGVTEGNPPPTGSPSLRIVSGVGYTDTITALVPGALAVQLTDARGKPMAGVPVQFTGSYLYFGPVGGTIDRGAPFGYLYDTTDVQGRAQVAVQLGFRLGTRGAIITVPSLSLADTAWYTVRTGQPAMADILSDSLVQFVGGNPPKSLAITVGHQVKLDVRVEDRGHNPTSSTATFSAVGAAAVSADGTVTAGAVPDTAVIFAHFGAQRDSIRVSVVPAWRLLGYQKHSSSPEQLTLINADGSGQRTLATVTYRQAPPVWMPDGAHVAYEDAGADGHPHVFVLDTATLAVQQVDSGATIFTNIVGLAPSPDGLHVYLDAQAPGQTHQLWAVTVADGTLTELVDSVAISGAPMPAADGHRIFMVRADGRVAILDRTTGAVTTVGANVGRAALSGGAASIAYVLAVAPGGLWLMNVDGSSVHQLLDGQTYNVFVGDLSPSLQFAPGNDGWIVTAATPIARPLVVLVATGGSPMLWLPLSADAATGYRSVTIHP